MFWESVIRNANGKLPNREPDFTNGEFLHWWKDDDLTNKVSRFFKRQVGAYITATGVLSGLNDEPLITYVVVDQKNRLEDARSRGDLIRKCEKRFNANKSPK